MRMFSKCLSGVLLFTALNFAAASEIKAQANNQKKLDLIVSELNSILPSGWKVDQSALNVEPSKWGAAYNAYRVSLRSTTEEMHRQIKGPGGRDREIRYFPFYTLYFVPLGRGLTLDKARKKQDDIVTQLGAAQESFPRVYGASNEYIIIFNESEKSSWRDGMERIAQKFNAKQR